MTKREQMTLAATDCIKTLNKCSIGQWPILFVELRMAFMRRFGQTICSTSHGIDFFENILAGPENWKEKGVYGDNFRNMFREA